MGRCVVTEWRLGWGNLLTEQGCSARGQEHWVPEGSVCVAWKMLLDSDTRGEQIGWVQEGLVTFCS